MAKSEHKTESEELFEARKPKGQAIITELGGKVIDIDAKGLRHVVLHANVRVDDVPSHLVGEIPGENIATTDGVVITKAGEPVTEPQYRKIKNAGIKEVVLRK